MYIYKDYTQKGFRFVGNGWMEICLIGLPGLKGPVVSSYEYLQF